jgi:hypothetical protein
MESRSEILDFIELLADNERALCKMYRAFSNAFPHNREFWSLIADDESNHAKWVEAAKEYVEKGLENVAPTNTPRQVVTELIDYVSGLADKAEQGTLTELQATSFSKDIESSIIDDKFFDLISHAKNPNLKEFYNEIIVETRKHYADIFDLWRKLRELAS